MAGNHDHCLEKDGQVLNENIQILMRHGFEIQSFCEDWIETAFCGDQKRVEDFMNQCKNELRNIPNLHLLQEEVIRLEVVSDDS